METFDPLKLLKKELGGLELEFVNEPKVPGPEFEHIWTHWRGDESINHVMPAVLSLADLLKEMIKGKITFYPLKNNKHLTTDDLCINVIKCEGLITYSVLVAK